MHTPVSIYLKVRDMYPQSAFIIRKSKFPQNPKRSVQKRKARNTQKAETKVL